MNLAHYRHEVRKQIAAEDFARALHDSWGVGHDTPHGGTGILIFLSVQDRVIYISRESALDRLVNSARIDKIIKGARPFLKRKRYVDCEL